MRLPTQPRASIAVQLILLVLACMAAMHLLLFAIVALFPPPRPPIYRVSEIAQALEGGSLASRDGRPMLRSVSAALPEAFEASRHGRPPPVAALAAALGRPGADVRLVQRRPGRLERMLREPVVGRIVVEHQKRSPPGPPGPDAMVETRRFEMRMDEGHPGRPPPGLHLLLMREAPVIGDFSAAVRRSDGMWTVVRSAPEPFPTDWQRRMLLLVAAAFGVVAPAAFLFARRITAPLKRFAEAAERLGRDPNAPPVVLTGPAEIGAAAAAFNDMQGRLRRYIEDRTAMVGAISHDLRTPLARIRFKLEGADERLRDSVLSDVGQMEQMIAGVLAFIRDESTPRRREKLDLLSLVECVVDDAALVGGDVEILQSCPAMVEGDAVALQRMFVNLVENALKYAGQARIRLRCEGGQAVVDIEDEGPGLSPADLERVFQPFYRADASRNLDSGGIGLGLPIARATARAHGGDVELLPQAQGLTARVTLPLA
ncbi:MAG: HAMP domain-containing protein [Phenylobacterium sp.]|uniref:sensor histidine kinase n=1 Tax=Phenylobacterium sp. TaxID=1871053 RepID=UPI001A4E38B6|nr:ATP-binding protein [Phenylobacterium sp.]MBL8772502.1 HAMP domain-containing protein [Phenylobacterium sp.]